MARDTHGGARLRAQSYWNLTEREREVLAYMRSIMTAAEIARGERRGRHDRSASSPTVARLTHFRAVRSHTLNARATVATGSPACTRRAIRARLCGAARPLRS